VFVVLLLLAGAGLMLAFWKQRGAAPTPAASRPAPRETVVRYLQALEQRDGEGILKLVPGDYAAAGDIADRLQRFGGASASGADIRITQDLSAEVVSATIRTRRAGGEELVWTENLFWRDGAWRLVLGGLPGAPPAADLQRPAP
jgi:hypothetical protein